MNLAIWDFDGTLAFRDNGGWTAAVWEVLQQFEPACGVTMEMLSPALQQRFPWHRPEQPHPHLCDAGAWWRNLQPVFVDAYRSVGLDLLRAQELATYVRPAYLSMQRWHCYDDVIPTLEELSNIGWTHAMLTNHVPELADIVVRLGLADMFTGIFNSAQTGYEKPNQRAFELVLEAYPEAVTRWMIGDSYLADICGAAAVGIRGILVHRPDHQAQYYCSALQEIPDLMVRETA